MNNGESDTTINPLRANLIDQNFADTARVRLWRRIPAQEGSALIYVTLILPVLIGMAGLTIDGSNYYWQQRRMQIAADAAALAGVGELALGNSANAVNSAIQSMAFTNGADTVVWNISADGVTVQAETVHTFSTYFAGTMGFTTLTVQAVSSAQIAAVTRMGNLLPMATMCDDMDNDADPGFTYGVTYTLWDDDPTAPGNVGWLDWNGGSNGASELADNIANPSNSGVWEVGDWIPSAPGVKNSAHVRQAIDSWIGQPVTIVLYDQVTGNGSNTEYRVCAFATFVMTDYNFNGSNKWVSGTFVRKVLRGGADGGTAPDFGMRTVRFIQ